MRVSGVTVPKFGSFSKGNVKCLINASNCAPRDSHCLWNRNREINIINKVFCVIIDVQIPNEKKTEHKDRIPDAQHLLEEEGEEKCLTTQCRVVPMKMKERRSISTDMNIWQKKRRKWMKEWWIEEWEETCVSRGSWKLQLWTSFKSLPITGKLMMFPGLMVKTIDFKRTAAERETSVGTWINKENQIIHNSKKFQYSERIHQILLNDVFNRK